MAFVRTLALDVATRTGWALWGPDMAIPEYGSAHWDARTEGTRNREAREWVRARIVASQAEIVVKEAYVPAQDKTNINTLMTLAYLHGMVLEVCSTLHVPCKDMPISTWRAKFLGTARTPKKDERRGNMLLNTTARRTAWWKRTAVERCEELGWHVKNDDAAEALGIVYAWREMNDRQFASLAGPLMARARVMA